MLVFLIHQKLELIFGIMCAIRLNLEKAMLCPSTLSSDGRARIAVNWNPPPAGYLKVNVDGAFYSSLGKAACGGLICDSNGAFVKGFVCNLGVCSVIKAEMKALLHGVQVARDMNISNAIFEIDSLMVVNLVLRGFTTNPHLKSLLEKILLLLNLGDWQTQVNMCLGR